MSDLVTVPTENWEYGIECMKIVQRLKDRKREVLVLMRKDHPEEHISGCCTYKDLLYELEKIFTGEENDRTK